MNGKPFINKGLVSAHGRSRYNIECPYCHAIVVAYIWSLAGSGKRCPCGAKHTWLHGTIPPQKLLQIASK
jgi:hypothetical protein